MENQAKQVVTQFLTAVQQGDNQTLARIYSADITQEDNFWGK